MAIQTKQMALLGLPSVLEGGTPYHRVAAATVKTGTHLDQEPSNATTPGDNLPAECAMWGAASKIGDVDAIGLVNHTLDRYRGSYYACVVKPSSAVGHAGLTPLFWKNYYPDIVDAQTNCSSTGGGVGKYQDVDDSPFSSASEADGVTSTVDSDWSIRFGFPKPATPSMAATAVTNDQLFAVRFGAGATGADTITIKLYENNVYLATLINAAPGPVSNPSANNVLLAPWSSSLLSTATGDNVQIQIEASHSMIVYAVCWTMAASIESETSSSPRAYYSGWVQIPGFDESTSLGGLDPELVGEEPQKSELLLLSSTLDYTTSVDGNAPLVGVAFAQASNTDDPVSLGVLLAGTVFRPERNFTSLSLGVHDESKKQRTLGGQDIISSRNRRRYANFTIPLVKRSQFAQLFERIDFRKGSTGAFLVSFFPEDDLEDLKRLSTFYATLAQEADQPWVISGIRIGGTNAAAEDTVPFRFEKTYSIEEKL